MISYQKIAQQICNQLLPSQIAENIYLKGLKLYLSGAVCGEEDTSLSIFASSTIIEKQINWETIYPRLHLLGSILSAKNPKKVFSEKDENKAINLTNLDIDQMNRAYQAAIDFSSCGCDFFSEYGYCQHLVACMAMMESKYIQQNSQQNIQEAQSGELSEALSKLETMSNKKQNLGYSSSSSQPRGESNFEDAVFDENHKSGQPESEKTQGSTLKSFSILNNFINLDIQNKQGEILYNLEMLLTTKLLSPNVEEDAKKRRIRKIFLEIDEMLLDYPDFWEEINQTIAKLSAKYEHQENLCIFALYLLEKVTSPNFLAYTKTIGQILDSVEFMPKRIFLVFSFHYYYQKYWQKSRESGALKNKEREFLELENGLSDKSLDGLYKQFRLVEKILQNSQLDSDKKDSLYLYYQQFLGTRQLSPNQKVPFAIVFDYPESVVDNLEILEVRYLIELSAILPDYHFKIDRLIISQIKDQINFLGSDYKDLLDVLHLYKYHFDLSPSLEEVLEYLKNTWPKRKTLIKEVEAIVWG